jgi:prepilin-type processing-associated H-X9-DG protein
MMRSTMYPILPDGEKPQHGVGSGDRAFGFSFGSAHPGGINVVFVDDSVRTINYGVDQELFNRLGNRSDSEFADMSNL